ncbi:Tn3 family transposase [Nocardia sp. SC052]|uniref:Tn3 family transposase n=1 Tax=Nocardia sichangensis TaxID=3385975 RepID=UPI0039A3973C
MCAGTSSPRSNLRQATTKLLNATFTARDPHWWGTGTSYPIDSKEFGSGESHLISQYHRRYGRCVMNSLAHRTPQRVHLIPAQILLPSEAAAMIEGSLRHCIGAEIEAITLIHLTASEVGSAFTELPLRRASARSRCCTDARIPPHTGS